MKDILKLLAVYAVLAALISSCAKDTVGSVGSDGSSCTVTNVALGAHIVCTDGTSAFVSAGAMGPAGIAGIDGQDAIPVTAVQLCPDVTPTYASVFPEYTLCISGHLYGTYNGNTSYQYFAELPDGAYSSNGQGAACSFTISGCSINY